MLRRNLILLLFALPVHFTVSGCVFDDAFLTGPNLMWLAGAMIWFVILLSFIAVLVLRSYKTEKRLEILVKERTDELETKNAELTKLVESAETHFESAKILSDALTAITKSPEIAKGSYRRAAEVLAEIACIAIDASYVNIWLYSEKKNALVSIASYNISTGKLFSKDDYDMTKDVEYVARLLAERLVVENDVSKSVPDDYYTRNDQDIIAMVEAPIHISGKFYGSVSIEQERTGKYPDKREWTMEEQQFTSSLADIMALALSSTERRIARDEANMANITKSEFIANMSHEIRTPMNSIIGFSELALDDDISPKTKDYLTKILDNSDWLLQIINNILDLSKIESGKVELESIPLDIHEIINACRTVIQPKAIEKGLALHFYAEPSIGKILYGDPTKLRQVLINLLSNAVKFTNSGMVKLQVEVIETGEDSITMRFHVKDSGIGIPENQIQKIFDPFMQADTATARKYGGTGLGLVISKSMIDIMGGELYVESVVDVGSRFSFDITFKSEDVDIDSVTGTTVTDLLEKPSFEGEVLLCEDNDMNRQVICEHLARVGLNTFIAENGKIGVDLFKERIKTGRKQFDLIFMDIYMPVMDGLEASEIIHKIDGDIPIVAITANVISNEMDTYRSYGIIDYLCKPFTSQDLWKCLSKYLIE